VTRKRTTIVTVCLVAALGIGVAAWAIVDPTGGGSASASADGRHTGATAIVTRGDLTDTAVFAGTLGYGTPTGVPGPATGTLTWLPEPGQVVERDGFLYAVDERGVRSMYGTVPFWRDLARGQRGTDVRQLNANLSALGYDVAQDDVFGPRTQRAVRQWQRDRGLEVTGVLTSADVAFVDGPVRIDSVPGQLGLPADGDVVQVTSTERIVTATVSQRDAERLAVGTPVDVRVNGAGDAMSGQVADVQPTAAEDDGSKVDVSVSFDPGDRQLPTTASAQVAAQGTTERGVLSVPVAALVAGDGGTYAVDVVRRDGTTKRVRVEPGFTADGRVAVTGDVAAGDRVVVPG